MAYQTFIAVTLATFGGGGVLSAADWTKDLEKKLEQKFERSEIGYKGSIKRAGTLFVLQADGIQAASQDAMMLPTNIIINGKLSVGGGFLSRLEGGDRPRTLGAGQKVYLQDIGVKEKEIKFILFTADQKEDAVLGTTRAQFLKAAIAFRFREPLDTQKFESILNEIGAVLASPGAGPAPKSISLGQTMTEVENALGKPEKVVHLGPKTIYTYKDLKITFLDGKVSDVQ